VLSPSLLLVQGSVRKHVGLFEGGVGVTGGGGDESVEGCDSSLAPDDLMCGKVGDAQEGEGGGHVCMGCSRREELLGEGERERESVMREWALWECEREREREREREEQEELVSSLKRSEMCLFEVVQVCVCVCVCVCVFRVCTRTLASAHV